MVMAIVTIPMTHPRIAIASSSPGLSAIVILPETSKAVTMGGIGVRIDTTNRVTSAWLGLLLDNQGFDVTNPATVNDATQRATPGLRSTFALSAIPLRTPAKPPDNMLTIAQKYCSLTGAPSPRVAVPAGDGASACEGFLPVKARNRTVAGIATTNSAAPRIVSGSPVSLVYSQEMKGMLIWAVSSS